MAIQVLSYTREWIPAVRDFNARMEATGARWRWYDDPTDFWIPDRKPGQSVWREHYVAIENGSTVRGAFALKPHEFLCRGTRQIVTDWQGPITEAAVDPRFAGLGLRLMREMMKRYPLLYSWGHGEEGRQTLEILRRLGFLLHPTPFCLRVVRPRRFLLGNAYLRGTPARRLALDLMAHTGAGSLAVRALHAAQTVRGGRAPRAEVEVVPEFGDWADDVWDRCAEAYSVIALRDRTTLNVVLPPEGWPHAIRLRVTRDGSTLGWAVVLDTQMSGDRRFGDLRVGSLIDGLALPDDAPAVVGAAYRFLRKRGVDLVFANQSHPRWIEALVGQGFLILEGRRHFAASPELRKALEPFEETRVGLYLTNMDGHGPIGL